MAKFDYKEFKKFAKQFKRKSTPSKIDNFFRLVLRELGGQLLHNVVEGTPVGQYNDGWVEFTTKDGKHVRFWASYHGKVGGTLRNAWKLTNVTHKGNDYVIKIKNNTFYAEFVEYGHRTVNGGFVEGRYMLKIAMDDLEKVMIKHINKNINAYLTNLMGGK